MFGRLTSSIDGSRLDRMVMTEDDRQLLRVRVRGWPMVMVGGPASGEEEETSSPCLFAKCAHLMAHVAIVVLVEWNPVAVALSPVNFLPAILGLQLLQLIER